MKYDSTTLKQPALALINAAERLIAQQGVENVSLLDIAKAAGQANKSAVQYHFGSKENLLKAIFEVRLEYINDRRTEMLNSLEESNSVTIVNLLKVIICPPLEMVGDDGIHYYAQFAMQLVDSQYAQAVWFGQANFQGTIKIRAMLSELTPHLSREEFELRMLFIRELTFGAIRIIDNNAIALLAKKRAKSVPANLIDQTIHPTLEQAFGIAQMILAAKEDFSQNS